MTVHPLIEACRADVLRLMPTMLKEWEADAVFGLIDARLGKVLTASAAMREQYAEFISDNTEIWNFERDQAAIAAYDAAVRDGQ